MAFTEFYVDSATGSNINAGDDKTVVTETNGDWDNAASNRFTAASGTPFSGVSVGDFASIYLDGATTAVYIGRVTAVNGGGASLDISATAKSGTKPSAGATGRSCTVGGKWAGPSGASGFPLTFVESAMVNVSGHGVRVNCKGTNSVTAAISHSITGSVRFQGYTSSPGDGGRWTLSGGTSGASYTVLTLPNHGPFFQDVIFLNNGATGSADGVIMQGSSRFFRCVFTGMVGGGVNINPASAGAVGALIECEAYGNNTSNTASKGGVIINGPGVTLVRCMIHDNTGSNTHGVFVAIGSSGQCHMVDCVVESNGASGFFSVSSTNNWQSFVFQGCDFYNNAGSGVSIANAAAGFVLLHVESCNLLKNGAYGITTSLSTGTFGGHLLNNGYGSGSEANTSGASNLVAGLEESGAVTYASGVTPWVDPANGDFRIDLEAAKRAGRGAFLQTQAGYSGTVAYPDIGAAQHQDSGGSSGGSFVFGT